MHKRYIRVNRMYYTIHMRIYVPLWPSPKTKAKKSPEDICDTNIYTIALNSGK